jgi:N-methylhydantoinase A
MSPADDRASTVAPTEPSAAGDGPIVVAVDTGGTFTDLVALIDGTLRTLKVPSTPDDPSRAILAGVRELLEPDASFVLLHGSTVATNALLERKGARVVLITNRNFTDVLEIGRQNRPQLYALTGHRPPPLVTRDDRWGIRGRRDADGSEHEPLDPDELAGLGERLAACGAEAVAVCLLHSYADPSHEQAVAAALDTSLPISLSADLLPEYREYERTSTTVVNASVAPVMARYLTRLDGESGAEQVSVMGSNGGMLSLDRAVREPAQTVLSGPAGGVVGALAWARRAGVEQIVTFDMGGTSTDVSFCPGHALHTREFEIGGHPVALPVIDIHTVGAGGGSIASVDAGGALRVGPQSAGAQPGPISYGRGGTEVTVTDAHVWLGRLPTDGFLGRQARLDRDAVRPALQRLADRIRGSLDETAEGVLAVADTAMERALRVISVERGHDPADLALVAFGGAGALHAAELATRLDMRRVLIPPDPGLLSAWGILTAPLTRERSRSLLLVAQAGGSLARADELLDELAREARADLESEGVDGAGITVRRWIDARYRGQSFEIRVAAASATAAVEAFHDAHEQRYGYRRDEAAVEIVTCRAAAEGPGRHVHAGRPTQTGAPVAQIVNVGYAGRACEAQRLERAHLPASFRIPGPAIITDYSATTWIPPEWSGSLDNFGILHLTR